MHVPCIICTYCYSRNMYYRQCRPNSNNPNYLISPEVHYFILILVNYSTQQIFFGGQNELEQIRYMAPGSPRPSVCKACGTFSIVSDYMYHYYTTTCSDDFQIQQKKCISSSLPPLTLLLFLFPKR